MFVTYGVFEDYFWFNDIKVNNFRDVIDYMIATNTEKFTLILQYGDYHTTIEIGTFAFKK